MKSSTGAFWTQGLCVLQRENHGACPLRAIQCPDCWRKKKANLFSWLHRPLSLTEVILQTSDFNRSHTPKTVMRIPSFLPLHFKNHIKLQQSLSIMTISKSKISLPPLFIYLQSLRMFIIIEPWMAGNHGEILLQIYTYFQSWEAASLKEWIHKGFHSLTFLFLWFLCTKSECQSPAPSTWCVLSSFTPGVQHPWFLLYFCFPTPSHPNR